MTASTSNDAMGDGVGSEGVEADMRAASAEEPSAPIPLERDTAQVRLHFHRDM